KPSRCQPVRSPSFRSTSASFPFRPNPGLADDFRIFCAIADEKIGERLGRPVRDLEPAVGEPIMQLVFPEDACDFAVEPLDDLARRRAGREHAKPAEQLESRQSLVDCGEMTEWPYIALPASRGDRPHAIGLQLRQRCVGRIEYQMNSAADEIIH